MKLTARSFSGMKGKHVPGREDPTSKGLSVESENVLRKSNMVMVGPHRLGNTAIYLFL